MLEKRSLSTKSATPSSRTLVSANAIPTALVFVLSGPTDEEVTLIAITIGAESRSELTKSRSSTACRFPGEACIRDHHQEAESNSSKPHLFVQYKLDTFLSLPRGGHPDLNSELLGGQHIPQERFCLTFAQYDTWETCGFAAATEIFNNGVRAKYLGGDVMRVRAINAVVFTSVEETDRSCFWRFGRKLGVECDEAWIRRVLWGCLSICIDQMGSREQLPSSLSSFSLPYIRDIFACQVLCNED